MESKFAPIAQLLVYTILPNGEVVADTEKLDIENCFANEVGVLFKTSPFLHLPFLSNGKIRNLCSLKDCQVVLLKLLPKDL